MKKKVALLLVIYLILILSVWALELTNPYLIFGALLLPLLIWGFAAGLNSSLFRSSSRLEGWGAQKYAEKIFNNSSNLIHVVDRGGNILRRNKASYETLGREHRDNLNLAEIVHPEDLDKIKGELTRMFEGDNIRGIDFRLVPEDKVESSGDTLPASMRGAAVTDYAGVLEFINHNEVNRLRKKLRESSARYRYLIEDAIDTLDSGVVLIDKNSQVVWINHTMEDFFDIDREVLIGREASSVLRSYVDQFRDAEDFLEVAERAYRSNSPVSSETCFLQDRFGRTERILEYRSIPIETDRYKGGRIEHYIDITEVKRLERNLREKTQRLEKSNEKLEEFSRGISHDLKAPLQTIEGYSEILMQEYAQQLGEKGKRRLEALGKTSQRLRDRIEGLLSYSSIKLEQDSFEPVNMNDIVEELKEDLDYILGGVDLKVSDSFPRVYGNRTLLIELFSNLLSNAVKYNDKENPLVEIGWKDKGKNYLFWVRDNGKGIKERYLEKIFQVFEKLNPRENPEGTGVGLALCKRIVEEHGGKIWAESELGQGTTFYFTLSGKADESGQVLADSLSVKYSDGGNGREGGSPINVEKT